MVRKVFEKAVNVGTPSPTQRVVATPSESSAPPRTAPGGMMGFMTVHTAAKEEAEALRAKVKQLEEEAPLRLLDAGSIQPSKWANRHSDSFATPEFEALKADILSKGGNVQPIKVRPRKASNEREPGEGAGFELVYGHRRHRACLELDLPVLAQVVELDDLTLFREMDAENQGRANLSPWEQGWMYKRALDSGLFASMRQLADALNVHVSVVSRALVLAGLPAAVIDAFPSPLAMQFRWGAPLSEAVQKDPAGVLATAKKLRESATPMDPLAVYAALTGKVLDRRPGSKLLLSKAGNKVGHLKGDREGRVVVTLDPGVIATEARRKALVKVIEDFLKA